MSNTTPTARAPISQTAKAAAAISSVALLAALVVQAQWGCKTNPKPTETKPSAPLGTPAAESPPADASPEQPTRPAAAAAAAAVDASAATAPPAAAPPPTPADPDAYARPTPYVPLLGSSKSDPTIVRDSILDGLADKIGPPSGAEPIEDAQ